jgi:phage gp29-like protein
VIAMKKLFPLLFFLLMAASTDPNALGGAKLVASPGEVVPQGRGGGAGEKLKTASIITAQRMDLYRRTQLMPLFDLTPKKVRDYHDQFERGYLYLCTKMWFDMARNDPTLQVVREKRHSSLAALDWEVAPLDRSKEAQLQAATLRHTLENLRATNVYDLNQRGGLPMLLRNLADAIGMQYSAHELIWSPQSGTTSDGAPMLGLEARFTPPWFFENLFGELRYVATLGGYYGKPLEPNGWLVAARDTPLLRAGAIYYLFKHYPMIDWAVYCSRNGMPGIVGHTDANPGTPQWEQDAKSLEEFGAEFIGLFSINAKIEGIDLNAKGELPYPKLVEYCDKCFTVQLRGADLSTHSRVNTSGASLQHDEADLLTEADAEWAQAVVDDQICRPVRQWAFGPDAPRLAEFRILTPDRRDAGAVRANYQLAAEMSLPVSKKAAYEDLNLTPPDPDDPGDVLEVEPPAPTAPDPNQPGAMPGKKGAAGAGPGNPLAKALEKPLTPAEEGANAATAALSSPVTTAEEDAAAREKFAAGLREDFKPLAQALGKLADSGAPLTMANVNAVAGNFPHLAREVLQSHAGARAMQTILARAAARGAVARGTQLKAVEAKV